MKFNAKDYPNLVDGAWTLQPEELKEAFMLVARVYSGEDPFDPAHYRIQYLDDEGEPHKVALENTPLNRILVALKEWYHEEPVERYISAAWRIFALSKLIRTGVLKKWIKVEENGEVIFMPGYIIFVAATLPLDSIEGFDPDVFVEAVNTIQSA